MAQLITNESLAKALIKLVNEQHFEHTPDSMRAGLAIEEFPSLDLAVAVFPNGEQTTDAVWANVLFSRDFPQGQIARIAGQAGPVYNIHYLKDQINSDYESIAWLPGADWNKLRWETLQGTGTDFVQPYPASLLKLMVLVGVAKLIDQGKFDWSMERSFGGITKTIDAWADSMIVASNNDATTALVSLLHHGELIVCQGENEINHLNALFAHYGLTTLKLSNTRANGGWRSADGAGVGNIHMTAWDTVRLLWLLSDAGPKAPWLAPEVEPILSKEGKHRVWGYLGLQGLHTILSSTSLAGVDGWQTGIPAHLSERWIQSDGSVLVEDIPLPADVRPANSAADAYFAHKTGNTENYCSDAGLVRSFNSNGRRYIIALLSNLGTRYQANPYCSSTWRIPALGQAIDQWIAQQVE
ncbi:serine hydrolase [Sapientia aquatica]|uniref:Serine hydrolase n=1 Tax=Sapientia aquatica TaxID=1549640 RepID=A0A4R5VXI9_9BURK|nr:serine hydrolase [Sapientia aquatica]TDK63736.1 hypothetical protein E2I14_14285 [Sapientia aquatica]